MTDINQVRQVLMNELGLTRESIRKLAEEIVTKTVDIHVSGLIESGYLERLANASVVKALKSGNYDRETLKSLVSKAAGDAFRDHIRDHLK